MLLYFFYETYLNKNDKSLSLCTKTRKKMLKIHQLNQQLFILKIMSQLMILKNSFKK